MSMMTTKVEKRNGQPTKDRHNFNFNSYKSVDYNHGTDFVNPNFREDCVTVGNAHAKPMRENCSKLSLPTDKQYISNYHDEGYNTDGKSNTSPSTTSPSSSSFSSMSTFDGSFHSPTSPSGGMYPNSYNPTHFAMQGTAQRCPVPQKPSLIQGNGKIHVNRHALIMAKKKDSPQEIQENPPVNLEDRLRALTTIEEEEPGIPSVSSKETFKKQLYTAPETEDHDSRHIQSILCDGGGEHSRIHDQGQTSGFFRAVPVEIAAPQHPYGQTNLMKDQTDNPINIRSGNYDDARQLPQAPQSNSNDRSWYYYKRYFEKDCDIPLHNIDAINRGKFVNAGSDNTNDKDINRHLRTSTTQPRGEQPSVNVNAPSISQHRVGGGDMELNASFSNRGFQDHSSQIRDPFHGFPQNSHRYDEHSSNQSALSNSVSELPLSYHTQSGPQAQNGNSYYPDNQHRFQSEQPHSNPSFHPQQHQFDNQPYHTSQHPQHHSFFNEQSRQTPDSTLLNSHRESVGSFNSLPRRREDQRLHPLFSTGDTNQFSENDVFPRRSWASSSTRAIPDRTDRYSWQLEPRSKQPAPTGNERYSLDLGNIPQLQQQIRATSEMCLQASKRHAFASSADIYKLFQGQKKTPAPPPSSSSCANAKDFNRTQTQSHRHSFHGLPVGSWARSQQNLHGEPHYSRDSAGAPPRQHSLFANNPPHPSPSPGPLRGDHRIPIPQTSWASSSSSTFPLTLSELPHVQRQSSGYSSENELQQIEQNAKAAKKTKIRNGPNSYQGDINADQEFVPVDPTQDHDSSSSIIENEPVYVNQPLLAMQRGRGSFTKSSPSQQSQLSTPPPPPLPARPQHLQQTPLSNCNGNDLHSRINVQGHNASSNFETGVESHKVTNKHNPPSPVAITQKQIINLNQKAITINSYVSNHPYNTNDMSADSRPILPGEELPTLKPLDFKSNHDQFSIQQKITSDYLSPPKTSNSSRSNRTNSSPCTPLSPLEIAQVLDVPFATNVISDECGDRLSTLV